MLTRVTHRVNFCHVNIVWEETKNTFSMKPLLTCLQTNCSASTGLFFLLSLISKRSLVSYPLCINHSLLYFSVLQRLFCPESKNTPQRRRMPIGHLTMVKPEGPICHHCQETFGLFHLLIGAQIPLIKTSRCSKKMRNKVGHAIGFNLMTFTPCSL